METAVAVLLVITGFGMIAFWVLHIFKGGLPKGLKTVENGGYIGFHVVIELITGLVCVSSGALLLVGRGPALMPIAAGMLLYTSINSLAWSEVKNKPVFAVMFVVPAIISLLTIGYYLSRP